MIDPKRSRYRKKTESYTKDSIFEIIDIQECLDKNKFIPKVNKEEFIYNCFEKKLNNSNQIEFEKYESRLETDDEIINRINKNRFGFRIEDLELEYKNGYKIKLIDKYSPIDIIGEGAFSTVISAFDHTKNCVIAIKIIVKEYNQQIEKFNLFLENETKIQLKLDHKNIVKLYEVVDNQDYLFMFIENMSGGTLKDLILERYHSEDKYFFRDNECALIIQGIMEALNYLHNKNIMHRDIKPENILFKDKNDLRSIKLGDFGLATSNLEKESKKCGTLLYMAPEIMNKKSYDHSIDIWATGFILYILLSGGRHPIYTKEMDSEAYMKEFTKEFEWNFPCPFPLLGRNLFLKMCKLNTSSRYEALKVLRHPWVTRSAKSNIPETLIDSYKKMNMINKFRHLLTVGVALYVYKINNQEIFSKLKQEEEEEEKQEDIDENINLRGRGIYACKNQNADQNYLQIRQKSVFIKSNTFCNQANSTSRVSINCTQKRNSAFNLAKFSNDDNKFQLKIASLISSSPRYAQMKIVFNNNSNPEKSKKRNIENNFSPGKKRLFDVSSAASISEATCQKFRIVQPKHPTLSKNLDHKKEMEPAISTTARSRGLFFEGTSKNFSAYQIFSKGKKRDSGV